ncbi:aromatic ring-hydroxylating dioxygenase subunit alpha [Massilia timonae]|jgi:phenylpropionate dioxygenase-like ring-hydroxylating dioxygenase large terminal subunit|uniref:Putative oxygenase n=1 Tax=Massilia timonae TaxID=47229 RepID=A0A1S2NFI2_9BURK|nr:aromatic ring-hydroxylating dioxygenase subunit alpha [Massilia timonae]OIJ43454.1 putative oxygenase [Massilia timonae]
MKPEDKGMRFAAPDEKRDWVPGNIDLRDTWFPVAYSADIAGRPVRRIIHAQDVYLWREQGRVRAAELHPELPGQPGRRPTAFTGGSGHYPVRERYGYVWVWYGNPDNAHEQLIPLIPFLPADGIGIPRYTQRSVRFDASSPLSVENLIDLTHADFLHANTIGDGRSDSDVVEFSSTSETLTRTRIVTRKSVAPVMRWIGGVRAQYQDLRAVLHVHLRNNLCISYPSFEPGYAIPNVQPFVPVGRHRSRVDQTNYTVHAPAPFRWLMPRISYVIQPQDNSVLRPQNARYFDTGQRRDLSSRFDAPGNRYRVLLARLAQRQQQGDFSYGADADPATDISRLLGMKA